MLPVFFLLLGTLVFSFGCASPGEQQAPQDQGHMVIEDSLPAQFIMVLGVAQDAGYPQAGCSKSCCTSFWKGQHSEQFPTCLALVDREGEEVWLLEATPSIGKQLQALKEKIAFAGEVPTGIFLTHAHIGHYAGLMHLGREVMGAKDVSVFAMPRMVDFLLHNGPWSQLNTLKNIRLKQLQADSIIKVSENFSIIPFQVPHRDEFSETVGFRIVGPNKEALFIPDIDKWHLWEKDILAEIKQVDYAFLDGTFFRNGELPGRDMMEIPHPFIEESMDYFEELAEKEKQKVHFIHFNHTNPIIWDTLTVRELLGRGFSKAEQGMIRDM